ncbi:MAG: hypothetical protein M3R01_05020, partial [Actinomycetota bacterium]|nr:hypothetical protein [Actinomycetota bacterium]
MRTLRIGVVLGLLAGIAAAVRRRLAGPDHRAPAALSVAPAATAPAPSPVPVPALDVDAALGPDPQPLRSATLSEPEIEVATGAAAEAAAADLDRQPAAAPDWQPPAEVVAESVAEGTPWVSPDGAACPASHP